jgi:hypothetical protein
MWLSIETAPKDGTMILAYSAKAPGKRKMRITWWRKPEDRLDYVGWGEFNEQHWPPTHWQPLPSPPRKKREGASQLLPCPFCGGQAESLMGRRGDESEWPYIGCQECSGMADPDDWECRRAALPSGMICSCEAGELCDNVDCPKAMRADLTNGNLGS